MENEFEFDEEIEGLEAFDEFDDFEFQDDITNLEMKTAIMMKGNLIALLCLKTANQGGAICRVDPREAQPSVQIYENAEKALEWWTESLKTSRDNGWKIAYAGLPLHG
jgi:hypothetical protein